MRSRMLYERRTGSHAVIHAFSGVFDHELEYQARLSLSISVRASYSLKYVKKYNAM